MLSARKDDTGVFCKAKCTFSSDIRYYSETGTGGHISLRRVIVIASFTHRGESIGFSCVVLTVICCLGRMTRQNFPVDVVALCCDIEILTAFPKVIFIGTEVAQHFSKLDLFKL